MSANGRHTRLVVLLLVAAAVMGGVAYASVPLYRMFCQLTGFGGTVQRVGAEKAAEEAGNAPDKSGPTAPKSDRWITVSFDSNVAPGLPWDFWPETKSLRVKVGEPATVTYHARNRGGETIVGVATYNVQPDKTGVYFDKIQCFCFHEQVLKAGETAALPVQFFIDPALAADRDDDDVRTITLSYTFFRSKDQNAARAADKQSGPSSAAASPSTATP